MPYYQNRNRGYRPATARPQYASYDRPEMPAALSGQGYDFVAQPAKRANECRYCGIMTDDWCVGVRAERKYYVVCNSCAVSGHHQFLSFVGRLDGMMDTAAGIGIDVSDMEARLEPVMPLLGIALSASGSDDMRRGLLVMLLPMADEIVKYSSPLYREVEALRAVMEDLPPRDRDFAESLVQQFDRTGNLSERQAPYVSSLTAKAQPVVTHQQAEAEKEARKALHGLHLFGGHIYRVDEDGTLTIRKGARWYTPSPRMMPIINAATLLTQEKAQQYGLETGRCCNCGKSIGQGDSRRSVAVGYGPECASRWGWYYPTEEEAERMLTSRV